MAIFNESPPVLANANLSSPAIQRQLQDYLFRLHEKLTYVLNNLGSENLDNATQNTLTTASINAGKAVEEIQKMPGKLEKLHEEIVQNANEITNAYQSSIETNSQRLESIFAETYTAKTETAQLQSEMESRFEQTAQDIQLTFTEANNYTVEVDGKLSEFMNEVATYIRFSEDGIELGELGSLFTTLLGNGKLSFMQGGVEVAYISNNKMYITTAEITEKLTIGNGNTGYFDWVLEANNSLSLARRS